MSQYTYIYLREKGRPILRFREYLSSADELKGLSEEQIKASNAEVDAYNETVRKSFGCALFHLDTTPSRQLEVLPYSEDARLLSIEALEDILLFYDERIQSVNHKIAELKTQIDVLEKRILMADPRLYNRINRDIEDHKDYISEEQASLASLEYFHNKFMFVKNILDDTDNSDYEIIYIKC